MKYFLISLILSVTMMLHAQEKAPSNKHFWHSLDTKASPKAIWQIWTDVSNWKKWDKGLKMAAMDSAFQLGAKGTITSLEGREAQFKVVEFEPGKSYTYKTKLPLGSLYVKRYLESKDGKLYFTHEVWFKGLTAGIFAKNFGPEFRRLLPEVMEEVKKIAENK